MRYLSICSGIEAATVAWHPLGWTAAGFAEIDAFPSAVLAHHYPSVRNFGDFTTISEDDVGPIDLLVGGTPCQSFSVAGLRGGLADDRGNLALEFCRLALRTRPRWLVWENVPGVLSSNGGRDFGSILGALAECGYGFAYRVLDAQYFGLAQRRKRVFVVGYLGDWRPAAAVLFERHGLQGHPAPRRGEGARVAALTSTGVGTCGADNNQAQAGHLIASTGNVAHCLNAGGMGRQDYETETLICADLHPTLRAGGNRTGGDRPPGTDVDTCEGLIAHTLRGEGFDASDDGTGRGTPIVPVAFGWQNSASQGDSVSEHITPTLDKSKTPAVTYTLAIRGRGEGHQLKYRDDGTANAILTPNGGRAGIGVGAVAFSVMENQRGEIRTGEITNALATQGGKPGQGYPCALTGMAVRRLTPVECARLQGFPDHYLDITYRGKPAADGPKYKALGNSMAVPVMAWIGCRIEMVSRAILEAA